VFSASLSIIKKRFVKKLPWNTLVAVVEQNILCLAWQDNNIVLGLSNIYIIDKAEDWVKRKRRRLIKTLINRHLIQGVFRDNLVKELPIPCFIDDYN
jgi:hypothetical protein